MAKKKKYYVVFEGKKPGIYETWPECQKQVKGVKGAKFKSFPSKKLAMKEYNRYNNQEEPTEEEIENSLSVDASCFGDDGKMEYRIVETSDGELVFHSKLYPKGTNNIGEFLALVEGMRILEQEGNTKKVLFTDSKTAISWVNRKSIKTVLERTDETEELFRDVDIALDWLNKIDLDDYNIVKWETHLQGEIKADFGRK